MISHNLGQLMSVEFTKLLTLNFLLNYLNTFKWKENKIEVFFFFIF